MDKFESGQRLKRSMAAALLLAMSFAIYFPVLDYQFVDLDDDLYVTDNLRVQRGLTWENFWWATTAVEAGFWHPLTWWSHMLDYRLFGLNPSGHHLTSLLLHLVNVLLLFWVLQELTGALWPSFFVAALFAVHPLNVESVAWIAERKNVLSMLFWLLTMWAYAVYVRNPGWKAYLMVAGLLFLGLGAKAMLVTLPCVLLLLDYWPLGRLGTSWSEFRKRFPKLVLEKAPLLMLVIVIGIVTIYAEQEMGAVGSLDQYPFDVRLANAAVSYLGYLAKMLWPAYLVVFYPHPGYSLAAWQVGLSFATLTLISVLVVRGARRRPYLLMGWLWYLGTLLPVSGLIQIGDHGMADRYAYVPLIGVFILMTWLGAEWLARSRLRKELWVGLLSLLLLALSLNSRLQLSYWQNGVTLLAHAIRSTDNNYLAHNNLGAALLNRGQFEESVQQLWQALAVRPNDPGTLYNLGLARMRMGERERAVELFSKALQHNPRLVRAHNNLGTMLMAQGRMEEASQRFLKALEIDPSAAEVHDNLGASLAQSGRLEKAIVHFRKALEINPHRVQAHNNLAAALEMLGNGGEAVAHYYSALGLNPNLHLTHHNLGKALLDQGDLAGAAHHFSRLLQIQPDFADGYYYLGLVRKAQGRTAEAIECFERVLKARPDDPRASRDLANLLEP